MTHQSYTSTPHTSTTHNLQVLSSYKLPQKHDTQGGEGYSMTHQCCSSNPHTPTTRINYNYSLSFLLQVHKENPKSIRPPLSSQITDLSTSQQSVSKFKSNQALPIPHNNQQHSPNLLCPFNDPHSSSKKAQTQSCHTNRHFIPNHSKVT